VRAELAALGGVEPALEQGAEDGDVDRAPVERGGLAQLGHVRHFEPRHFDARKQPAVEPGQVVGPVEAAVTHGGKELLQALGEAFAAEVAVAHEALEHAPGQQAHVFGKEAKQALREEVRHRVGVVAAAAQLLGQGGKALRGGFGDGAVGELRAKARRV